MVNRGERPFFVRFFKLRMARMAHGTKDYSLTIAITNNKECDRCLFEAAEMKTGYQLRNLFVMILALCKVTYPIKLWKAHKNNLCEDILYRVQKQTKKTYLKLNDFMIQTALIEIDLELRITIHRCHCLKIFWI